MNYYDELLKQWDELYEEDNYTKLRELMNVELKMPYVPKELLNKIEELDALIPKENKEHHISLNDIEKMLKGDEECQMAACYALKEMNLRSHIELCEDFLISKGSEKAKAILIYALIEQEIKEEIKCIRHGLEINFTPSYMLLPQDSEGFALCYNALCHYYEKDPSSLSLALQLLSEEAIDALPLDIDENEGKEVAERIIKRLNELFL